MNLAIVCLCLLSVTLSGAKDLGSLATELRELEELLQEEEAGLAKRTMTSPCDLDTDAEVPSTHSACLTPSSDLVEALPPDTAEQADILTEHNNYRSGVSPAASDMLKMVWDEELAMVAQRWASNCLYQHDANDDRNIPGKYSVGQNMGAGTGQLTWTQMVGLWYSEVDDFTYGSGGAGTGHYTQVVWAASSKVGCGGAKCSNGLTILVCNYAPAGNYANQLATPYAVETTPSSCASCSGNCENNLCVCEDSATTTSYCKNRGVLNAGTCSCDCSSTAYTGTMCDQCEDTEGLWGYSCEFLKGINYCMYSNIQEACCQTCLGG